MKKLCFVALVCAVAIAARLVDAQTAPPRQPVVIVHPSGGAPAPTPTPLPDPTGAYVGNVVVGIFGLGSATQSWRIDLKSRSCPECVPGQYFISGTNFNGTAFNSGAVERGGVFGAINPNGQALDLYLFAINCPFVNPSGNIGSAPYSGYAWSGSFGGQPSGVPVTIQNGSMTGRFSGRDCFGRSLTADVSLQRQSTSVPAACNSIAGNYNGSFANSCGGNASGAVTIVQTGCDFSASLAAIGVGVEGTITGPTSAQIRINDVCGTAIYGGSMTINGGTITGTYSGVSNGGFQCCPAGPVSGSFALTKI
jgi:hypothetical protein